MAGQTSKTESVAVPYETRLDNDPNWALWEGSRHFEEKSLVFDTLRGITTRLDDLGVPHAVAGDIALFRHGLRRFTEFVEILVGNESLTDIRTELAGIGYLLPNRYSKNLRDAISGVRIEFLTTGDCPGDGNEKPVAFPDPGAVSFDADGIRYIDLPSIVELKLASGMTNPLRMRDLADVLELIKILGLSSEFAKQLNPYVRDRFLELWRVVDESNLSGEEFDKV
jgi:hypothetical protein